MRKTTASRSPTRKIIYGDEDVLQQSLTIALKESALLQALGILLLAAILLAACAPVAPTFTAPTAAASPTPVVIDLNQLHANPWTLVAYGDPANPTVVQGVTSLTAQFAADGSLSGFGGCNNYSGTYQAGTDGTLKVGPLATTAMACAEGMDQETAYLTALQTANSFSFTTQGQLQVKYMAGKEQVMVFAIGQKPLTSTNWVLISMGDPENPQPVPAGNMISAVFSDDGALSGSGGCNQYNTSLYLAGRPDDDRAGRFHHDGLCNRDGG